MKAETKRQNYERLRAQLKNERSSFLPAWRDQGDYILSRRPRWTITDANKGDRRNQKIIDSTATMAARTLQSGMMSGITSPARPWFKLTTPDPVLSDMSSVKRWLDIVSSRMTTVFMKSNIYNVLPTIYGDLGVFGTSAMHIEEDFDSVIRAYAHPIGSYLIAQDERLRVCVFMREFRMTVRQLISKFAKKDEKGQIIDWSNFSTRVKSAWDAGNKEDWVDVCHVIMPNEQYDPRRLESQFKRFISCYYEIGSSSSDAEQDRYLSEKGYDYFPVLAPRWGVTGEDVYGTDCPGSIAIGDIKQLQLGEKRIAQAIEKMVNPPMTGPTSLKNQKASILPGDITFVDVREGQQGFRPAQEVNPRVMELENKQGQIRSRVSRAFFEDLFLMLAQSDRRQITAREIDERHEEKLLALGPVLEQLNQDLLDPLIDITFQMMDRQGMIPAAPEELQGMPLKVEYISIMAQAQKLVGLAGIERFMGFVGQVGAVQPEVYDKLNMNEIVDTYAEAVGVAPKIVRTEDEVAQIQQQRAQAQQAQQQMEMIQQGAGAAKTLSQTDTGGNNALTQLMQQSQAGQLVGAV